LSAAGIKDHAVVGDRRTAALIASDATVDWLCLPNFSSPSVFAAILDPQKGGAFSLRPTHRFRSTRRYRDGAPVLETEFTTDSGRARIVDCMTILDGVLPMRPARELLRIVEGVEGHVELSASITLIPDYAQITAKPMPRGSLGWIWRWDNSLAVLRSELGWCREADSLTTKLTTAPGSRHAISLSFVKDDMALFVPLGEAAAERLERTTAWWRGWSERCRYDGPHRDAVHRSAVVLALMTFTNSGAMVAAPSCSLPETLGGERNWDYRYCWLRDAGLTARALLGLGYVDEARAYVTWLLHATRLTRPELRVLYDEYGRNRMVERELTYLSGYANSRPVRVGNAAHAQLQLDVYGQTVLAAEALANAGVQLDGEDAAMLRDFGKVVCRRWREPDCGIWEIRGAPRQFTLSKVMCWAAMDRLLALDEGHGLGLGQLRPRFLATREAIETEIETHARNRKLGCYTSEFDGESVDASLLLIPSVGYRAARDPAMTATYERLRAELSENGLQRRYATGYDDFAASEACFGICSFWAVETLALAGRIDEAEALFTHILSFANDLGLFAEEIDPVDGAALGNFPQAFSHVGLINSALAIERARGA
jgi:GH15 family glucan-1,4-alpha-glucosidase